MSNQRVYIIIVNWNGWRDTVECLESLCLLRQSDYRIVVCDNGSTDDSLVQLRQWATERFGAEQDGRWRSYNRTIVEDGGDFAADPLIVLIENAANLGFGGGNNVGLRYALARGDAKYFWLLNNDTVVTEGALSALIARLEAKPLAGMCGSVLRYYDRRDRVQALGGARYYPLLGVAWHLGRERLGDYTGDPEFIEQGMSYVVGASLLATKSFIQEIGLLAEEYFLYFEEVDWAWRAKGRYTLAFAPDSLVYHKVGASIGTSTAPWSKSLLCDYYALRNRLVFTRKYCPWALPTIYAVLGIEFFVRVVVGRWDLARQIVSLIMHNSSTTGSHV